MNQHRLNDTPKAQQPVVTPIKDTALRSKDTTHVMAPPVAAPSSTQDYKVVVGKYSTNDKAMRRQKQLAGYGHAVEVFAPDSTTYYVVVPIHLANTADTAHIIDSFKHVFPPAGIHIYH